MSASITPPSGIHCLSPYPTSCSPSKRLFVVLKNTAPALASVVAGRASVSPEGISINDPVVRSVFTAVVPSTTRSCRTVRLDSISTSPFRVDSRSTWKVPPTANAFVEISATRSSV